MVFAVTELKRAAVPVPRARIFPCPLSKTRWPDGPEPTSDHAASSSRSQIESQEMFFQSINKD
jgi:hypothetical protein